MLARIGLRYPIIQAPMAGVSTPELAAAVSNAGALGSLGLGASTAESARRSIEKTQALTTKPFNVNVFCHKPPLRDAAAEQQWIAALAPLFEKFGAAPPTHLNEIYLPFSVDMLAVLLDLRPAVVSFHFGLPSPQVIAELKAHGIFTMATATCLKEARQIEKAGVDSIVAQGYEAGGHRGMFDEHARDEQLSTSVLVRLLKQRTSLPIVAAGGIMDGAGIRAALDLGAAAAQLGTAFVACPESAANEAYRQNLHRVAHGTCMSSAFSGRPARGLVNEFSEYCAQTPVPPAAYPLAYDLQKQLSAASGPVCAAQWAGQGAPLARNFPAAELVQLLADELAATPI